MGVDWWGGDLWLGSLLGWKVEISPCGDKALVPLVTCLMCPAASSSMVGVIHLDIPSVFCSREALMEEGGEVMASSPSPFAVSKPGA